MEKPYLPLTHNKHDQRAQGRSLTAIPHEQRMTQLLHNAAMTFAMSEAVTSASEWTDVLAEWPLTPVSDALLLLVAVAYIRALRRRRRSGSPRSSAWRAICFLCGLLVIVVALNTAIGVYAMTSHAVHMVQHLLLITVAPVLLGLGHPLALVRDGSAHGREMVDVLRHNSLAPRSPIWQPRWRATPSSSSALI